MSGYKALLGLAKSRRLCRVLSCVNRDICVDFRPQSGELDDVATGAARNNVLQRMKLNNKVALITGERT